MVRRDLFREIVGSSYIPILNNQRIFKAISNGTNERHTFACVVFLFEQTKAATFDSRKMPEMLELKGLMRKGEESAESRLILSQCDYY